jgi:uncharacterized protein (TIGR03435 family)
MERSGRIATWGASVVLTGMILAMPLAAQDAPAFEVASVKRAAPGATGGGFSNGPWQFTTRNYALRSLIYLAYRVPGYRVLNLPGWADGERYDIVAKTPAGAYTPEQRAAMIRGLLEDRFKLKTHRESRETSIYALVPARADKKLGPNLKPSVLDCDRVTLRRRVGAS